MPGAIIPSQGVWLTSRVSDVALGLCLLLCNFKKCDGGGVGGGEGERERETPVFWFTPQMATMMAKTGPGRNWELVTQSRPLTQVVGT